MYVMCNFMNKLLIILIAIIFTNSVNAECGINGLHIFPNTEEINKNSIFMIEGYSMSQDIIHGLNIHYPIYLKNGNKTIPLEVQEICIGEFNLTQAILKPVEELESNLEYDLLIDNLPEHETYNKYGEFSLNNPIVKYRVLSKSDKDIPKLELKPEEIGKIYLPLGCGDEIFINFNFKVNDESPILVKARVKNLATQNEVSYYLVPNKDTLQIGHSMCAGAFKLEDSDNFEVVFDFMDSSGNTFIWKGKKVRFSKPTKFASL